MTQLLTHILSSLPLVPKPTTSPLKSFKYCDQLSKSCQKLGVILENKVVQKLKFPKSVNNKRCTPKIKFFNEKKFRKIWIIFEIENWLWKSEFCHFWTTFTQLIARLKNFLRGWLLVLGLKGSLEKCETVCVKSEDMLCSLSHEFKLNTMRPAQ